MKKINLYSSFFCASLLLTNAHGAKGSLSSFCSKCCQYFKKRKIYEYENIGNKKKKIEKKIKEIKEIEGKINQFKDHKPVLIIKIPTKKQKNYTNYVFSKECLQYAHTLDISKASDSIISKKESGGEITEMTFKALLKEAKYLNTLIIHRDFF